MNEDENQVSNSCYSWSYQPFDTEVLGFKVAKIVHEKNGQSSEASFLTKSLSSQDITYATIRVESNSFDVIHALEREGFILVDGLISLSKEITDIDDQTDNEIGAIQEEDFNDVIELSKDVFFLNRLYNDPFIPNEKAKSFYAKWMENSLNGQAADEVLVYKENGKVYGFVTLKKDGHITLLGVSKDKRGKGIAKRLVGSTIVKFSGWEVKESHIETQMGNIPALRAYISLGFKITNSHMTFAWHKNA